MKFHSLTAAACALVVTFAASAPVLAASPYGAIATEQGNDDAIGHATGYNTKEGAVAAAIAECNKYTHGKDDCTLRVWFHKEPCASYAADSKSYNYYFGQTKAEVVKKAEDDGWSSDDIVDAVCN